MKVLCVLLMIVLVAEASAQETTDSTDVEIMSETDSNLEEEPASEVPNVAPDTVIVEQEVVAKEQQPAAFINGENKLLDEFGNHFVSGGLPVTVQAKGITITPLPGWEVRTDYPGLTLILQAPKDRESSLPPYAANCNAKRSYFC